MGKTDGGGVFISPAASGIFPEDVSDFFGKRRKENLTDRLFSCKIRITVCTLSSGDRAFGSGPKGRRFESCRVQKTKGVDIIDTLCFVKGSFHGGLSRVDRSINSGSSTLLCKVSFAAPVFFGVQSIHRHKCLETLCLSSSEVNSDCGFHLGNLTLQEMRAAIYG